MMPLPPANATIGASDGTEHEEPRRAHHLDRVARRERVVHPVRHAPLGDALHRRGERVADVGRARHRVAAGDGLAVDRGPERAELPGGIGEGRRRASGGTSRTNDRVSAVSSTTSTTVRAWYSWSVQHRWSSGGPRPCDNVRSPAMVAAFPTAAKGAGCAARSRGRRSPRWCATAPRRFGDAEAVVDGDRRVDFADARGAGRRRRPCAARRRASSAATGSRCGRRTRSSGSSPRSA